MGHLRFEKQPRPVGRKTDVYEVWTGGKSFDEDGAQYADLGKIKWYPAWRRYVFFPLDQGGTLFDAGCLRELAAMLDKLMAARRPAKEE